MLYNIRYDLFLLFFFVLIHAASAQENTIITMDDLQLGTVELDCSFNSESSRRFTDKYWMSQDKSYILVAFGGGGPVFYETDKKYHLILAKKAYQYMDSYFSVLLSRGNDKEAFVAYYPDFPTPQNLRNVGDLCKAALGSHCYHAVFHDKDDTYCFQYVTEDNRPLFFRIMDSLMKNLK